MKPALALGTLLLLLTIVGITVAAQRSYTRQSPLRPPPNTCTGESPALQRLGVLPVSAGQVTGEPPEVILSTTGTLTMQICRSGLLTWNVSGEQAQGSFPLLTIYRNSQLFSSKIIGPAQAFSLPVKAGDQIDLALTNGTRFAAKRYLTVTRLGGPWCTENAGRSEGGAWMRAGNEYGDITSGGKLHFRTCDRGTARFRVQGVSEGEAVKMQVLLDGQPITTWAVTGLTLVGVDVTQPSTITFTVLNPLKTVQTSRKLYLRDLRLR